MPAPEKFLRVEMRIPQGWEETLAFMLQEEGWGSVIQEQQFPSGILAGENDAGVGRTGLVLLLSIGKHDDFRRRVLSLAEGFGWQSTDFSLHFEEREDEDWESLWRARWRAFRCGNFVVHANFHDVSKLHLRASDRPICMVAGSAFGTGGHSSTRMALRTVQRWWQEEPFESMLDVGTGSGILGVAAAMLGVRSVFGMDPDPSSALQATETAEANKVGTNCQFWRGTADSAVGKWPVVMGNLQSDILVQDAAQLSGLVEKGGRFFGGGILDLKAARTIDALANEGLKLNKMSTRGRWVTGEFRKQ